MAATVAALALLIACSESQAPATPPNPTPSPEAISSTPAATDASPSPAPSPEATSSTPAPTEASPSPAPSPNPSALTGFTYPLQGACLPTSDTLLPNAPREYRAGIHNGIDFYPGFACAAIAEGTPVLAAKDGVVTRADWGFVEMTGEELDDLLSRSLAQGYTNLEDLDRLRGRQVWIDHGGGVVTRYAHLGGIASGIDAGTSVKAGDVVAYVGNSGTPQAVTAPNTEMHLHFEIRVGDSYLGAGLAPDQVRALLEEAFSTP